MRRINLMLIVCIFCFSVCNKPKKKTILKYENGTVRYEWINENHVDSIIEYFQNGYWRSIVIFNDRIKTDTPFILFKNKISINYSILTGNIIYFYPNGVLMKNLNLKNGLMDKTQYKYYPNGKLEVKTDYVLGRIEGIQYEYYDNGNFKCYGLFIGDTCVGGFSYFDTLGRLKKYLFSDSNGSTIYIRRYNTLGKVISEEGDSTPVGISVPRKLQIQ